jgi:hypothetical protein
MKKTLFKEVARAWHVARRGEITLMEELPRIWRCILPLNRSFGALHIIQGIFHIFGGIFHL